LETQKIQATKETKKPQKTKFKIPPDERSENNREVKRDREGAGGVSFLLLVGGREGKDWYVEKGTSLWGGAGKLAAGGGGMGWGFPHF